MGTEKETRAGLVKILCTEGCADTPPTLDLVKKVAHSLNILIEIQTVMVRTEEQARELGFLGSPTVQIKGLDIDPSARNSVAFGLT